MRRRGRGDEEVRYHGWTLWVHGCRRRAAFLLRARGGLGDQGEAVPPDAALPGHQPAAVAELPALLEAARMEDRGAAVVPLHAHRHLRRVGAGCEGDGGDLVVTDHQVVAHALGTRHEELGFLLGHRVGELVVAGPAQVVVEGAGLTDEGVLAPLGRGHAAEGEQRRRPAQPVHRAAGRPPETTRSMPARSLPMRRSSSPPAARSSTLAPAPPPPLSRTSAPPRGSTSPVPAPIRLTRSRPSAPPSRARAGSRRTSAARPATSPVGTYGRLATIRSKGPRGRSGASRSPSTNVTGRARRSALPCATASASDETSLARTARPGRALARARAMAPEPVPTSATRPDASAGSRSSASSTAVSVSGRGISTRASTARSRLQNSLRPVM